MAVIDQYATDPTGASSQSGSNRTTEDVRRSKSTLETSATEVVTAVESVSELNARDTASTMAARIPVVPAYRESAALNLGEQNIANVAQAPVKANEYGLSLDDRMALMIGVQASTAKRVKPTAARIEYSKRAISPEEKALQDGSETAMIRIAPSSEVMEQAVVRGGVAERIHLGATVSTSAQMQDTIDKSGVYDELKGSGVSFAAYANGINAKDPVKANLRLSPGPPTGSFILSDFFLTSATEATREKVQFIQTFGADFMFAYGRTPLMYSFSGVVYNTKDKQWRNNLRTHYDNSLRATQLVRNKQIAILTFEDVVVHGYLLNLDMNVTSQNPHAVPFSFSMYIVQEYRTTTQTNQTNINLLINS